ncbi:hypothetical protein N5C46_16330 [Rossellomorea vietnamensis]|uniref:Uncharacterized protein n=1 Tax=Rossellomorea vietnamensis TaxID=218284 RepID=A0ACD4C4A4_9BACI|nr:hypothetical protein [Rossellomorea vietnamensis]UXH43247.1 hypothetical protein N5C46_16330 [Rossellomorea vietnamensis]
MSSYKIFLSYLIFVVLLFGIVVGVKTKEVQKSEYKSVGNEYSLLNFGLGERYQEVSKVMKNPESKDEVLDDEKQKLRVHFTGGEADYLITSNKKFKIEKTINVGDDLEKVIDNHLDLDLFEYKADETDEQSYVYMIVDEQTVVLEVKEGKISKILLAQEEIPVVELIGAFNEDLATDEFLEMTDEELLDESKKLSFRIDYEKNNRKVLSDEFQQYLDAGLLPETPLPIGYSEKNLFNKYGEPVYIFEGKGDVQFFYYYKQFNAFVGYNEDKRLIEIKFPVNIPADEFEKIHGDLENDMDLGDNELKLTEENGTITEIILKEK